MRQNFILEKADIDTLKTGGSINLSFNGGNITLMADLKFPRTCSTKFGAAGNVTTRVLEFLRENKKANTPSEIAKQIDAPIKPVYAATYSLKARRLIVNSDSGWRAVVDTTATKPSRLVHSNGN